MKSYRVNVTVRELKGKPGRVEAKAEAFVLAGGYSIGSVRVLTSEDTALEFALESLAAALREPHPEREHVPYHSPGEEK